MESRKATSEQYQHMLATAQTLGKAREDAMAREGPREGTVPRESTQPDPPSESSSFAPRDSVLQNVAPFTLSWQPAGAFVSTVTVRVLFALALLVVEMIVRATQSKAP